MVKKQAETETDRWRVTSPETLLSTPIMDLVSSRVQCGRTGVEKNFYKFEFPRWVNVVASTDKGELLLIRQYRFGTGRVELEIPGGAVNEGEPPLEAGLRELQEETGYGGQGARIIGSVRPNPAIQGNLCYTVLVENVKKVARPALDDMEDIEVLLMEEDQVFGLIKDGTINHGLVLNGLMYYAMAKQKNIW
jgi:8-oxo-dGTP pyrophosphatase MutT (NUDIX family)